MRRFEDGGRNVLGHAPEPVPPQDEDAELFFDAMRVRLSALVDPGAFGTWVRPARGWSWEDGPTLVIALPTVQFVLWYRALYMGRLATAAREQGREGLRFRFLIVDPEPAVQHEGSIR